MRVPRGVEGAAAQCRLDHHGASAQRGDHPVADQETVPGRHPAWWPLADERALLADGPEQLTVANRVVTVHAARENRNGRPAHGERALVRAPVDPEGTPGPDPPPFLRRRY